MACQDQPSLTSTPQASCGNDPYAIDVTCSEVYVKFAEMQTEIEIELGFFSSNIFARPKLQPRQIGSPTHKIKYQSAEYLAGTFFQVHDYFCAAPQRIIGLPEVVTRKARINGGSLEDAKFFKKEPWDYFGQNTGTNFSVLSSAYDQTPFETPEVLDNEFFLRQAYAKEAQVVINRLKQQESNFFKYFNGKAIHRVDYTSTLALLYALAASGKLGIEAYTNKLKIGDNAQNPGTTRKVKMVHNLYFKIVVGTFCSNAPTSLTDVKLEGKDFTSSGVSHDEKNCLKCIIVLNKEDGSDNDKGVYFTTMSWGKGDPNATFMNRIVNGGSCVGEAADGGTSGKASATQFTDILSNSDRGGESNPLSRSSGDFVKIYEENEFIGKVTTRAQQLRLIRMERDWALAAAAAGEAITSPNMSTIIYPKIWSNANDVPAVRLAKPDVKSAGNGGFLITPGLWLFLTPGANVTSGDIQGSAAQIQFLWPLETLCLLGDDDLTLATLPGTLWNMFGSGIAVIKVDYVQGTKDSIATVSWYGKMQQAMARMKEFKTKLELMQAKFMQYQQQLINAFTAQDLQTYDKVLNQMQNLATEFYNLTKIEIDLKSAYDSRNSLESYLNLQGLIQNPVPLFQTPPTPPPPEILLPDRKEPVSEVPGLNVIAVPEANVTLPNAAQSLVIPGDSVISITPLPFSPEILSPSLDTPRIGSAHLLDTVGSGGSFETVPGTTSTPSEEVWDGGF